MSLDLTRLREDSSYDVTWASYAFGGVDDVDPTGMSVKTRPIVVGSAGDVELGERIIALQGVLVVQAREIDLAFIKKMIPWYSSGTKVPLFPGSVNVDRYSYANLLRLHPTDVADATQDLVLLKAVADFKYMKRTGKQASVWDVTFKFWPDRSATGFPAVLDYGYVGIP